MNPTPLFSVVLIARNESKTLPRLIASLSEFQHCGGEIVLLDTGSTDGTPDVARGLGCKVWEIGNQFLIEIPAHIAEGINLRHGSAHEPPIVKAGDKVFDFSGARNYAAGLASNDMIAMPDCDEVWTRLDLDHINQAIKNGVEQFEYEFVFAHDAQGREAIKFAHSKFYNRTKMIWVRVVHEVLQGQARHEVLPPTIAKLEHYQNHQTNRSNYLTGLAYDVYHEPTYDRNSFYFARELYYSGRLQSAVKEFRRHLGLSKFIPELAQNRIFTGDCFLRMGKVDDGLAELHNAFLVDGGRREALIRLAEHFWRQGDPHRTAAYAVAATVIPWSTYFANDVAHYTEWPHEMAYWALWNLNDVKAAEEHWRKAIAFNPTHTKYLHDMRLFVNPLPRVSVIIPTLGREKQLQQCLDLIKQNANYPETHYEVIVKKDNFSKRRGVPVLVKEAVAESTGDLILYLGNDCRPQPNFMAIAVWQYLQQPGPGLVGFNDGYWHGEFATHWLAGKDLLPLLDGEFFHTGYKHYGCDNELTARAKQVAWYKWLPKAKVLHDHPVSGAKRDKVNKLAETTMDQDRDLLKKRAAKFGFEYHDYYSLPDSAAK